MKRFITLVVLVAVTYTVNAQNATYVTDENVPYYSKELRKSDAYINERCVVDVYYPKDKKDFATIVWFHGGGLTAGHKEIPEALKNKGVAIVGVNYRLYPKIKAPVYIEDAAAAVAWVFKNISNYGGNPNLIFVSGHSAGGYLTSMVGLDKEYLAKFGVDANAIAGLIPFSGHTITHFTVRAERGIPGTQITADSLAPIYHVRKDAPPLLLITGDRELEMLGRYEENAFMMRMMRVVGHDTRLLEMQGYGHMMTHPAFPILLKEVNRIVKLKKESR